MKALLTLTLLAALAFAGCTSAGPATPAQDAEGNYVIHMTATNKFTPMNAKIPVGSTVLWFHDGGAPHDVQGSNSGLSSGGHGGLKGGDSFRYTFEEPGTYEYFCHVHLSSGMKGTLLVE